MPWSTIIGQDRVKKNLQSAWRNQRVPGAYLFYGPEGVGKDTLAMSFAALLNCEAPSEKGSCGVCKCCHQVGTMQHPNVKFICALPLGKSEDARKDDPISKLDADTLASVIEELAAKQRDPYYTIAIPRANEIKMSSIRDIKKELSMSSAGGKRVVIISRADMMSAESQNALLKTLEEPPKNSVFILTSAFRDRLQATVRSRCQSVRCNALAEADVAAALVERDNLDPATAALCAELGGGSYGLGRKYADEEFVAARKKGVDFLRMVAVNNIAALYAHLDELSRTRDRALIEQFLLILLFWFRDAEMLRLGSGSAAHIAEGGEALRKFVDHYPNARCNDAIKIIETAASDIRRNANVFLVLRVLVTGLRQALK